MVVLSQLFYIVCLYLCVCIYCIYHLKPFKNVVLVVCDDCQYSLTYLPFVEVRCCTLSELHDKEHPVTVLMDLWFDHL